MPYTFVAASIQARRLLEVEEASSAQCVFIKEDEPIKIFLHSSLGDGRINMLGWRIAVSLLV